MARKGTLCSVLGSLLMGNTTLCRNYIAVNLSDNTAAKDNNMARKAAMGSCVGVVPYGHYE